MSVQLIVREDGSLAIDRSKAGAFRATGTPDGIAPLYGHGGLFGVCDSHPTVINAMVGPMGIESALDWVGTDTQNPMYESLVWMGTSGYAQAGLCDACGKPSFTQCTQSACFSRICQMTNEHAFDQIGMRANEGVGRKALFGNITDPSGNVLVAEGQQISDIFTLELAAASYFLRYRVNWMLWNGNPANNLGGAWQHNGFQIVVNTGKYDVRTQTDCDGLDSTIVPYNAVIGAAGAANLSTALSTLTRSINYRITGMDKNSVGARQFFAMHPRSWDCVARQMACEYGLVCNTATDRNDALALREIYDKIKSTLTIPVDGKWYPVILDNTMQSVAFPYGANTAFRSDIYFFTTELEGETILWGEFQDLNKTAGPTLAWFRQMTGGAPIAITDNGRFAWAPTNAGGFCFDARVLTKTRVIARMPQLSGRLTGVSCVPTGNYPDVTGSGGLYELTGGIYGKPYMGIYNCGQTGGTIITRSAP